MARKEELWMINQPQWQSVVRNVSIAYPASLGADRSTNANFNSIEYFISPTASFCEAFRMTVICTGMAVMLAVTMRRSLL